MRTRSKLILAALTASLLMGLAVSSASAGRLSTSNTRFRITWNNLKFEGEEGGLQQTCRVTLEGSFHSATLRKVERALIGAITRGIVDSTNCRGTNEPHRATILQETLPWHVTYESFRGTLPDITEIQLLLRRYDFRFSATILGITGNCLYLDNGRLEENLLGNVRRNIAGGALTEIEEPAGRRAGLLIGTPFREACPPFGRLTGTGQVFLQGNTTRISITLI
jgi:hypothetical protein